MNFMKAAMKVNITRYISHEAIPGAGVDQTWQALVQKRPFFTNTFAEVLLSGIRDKGIKRVKCLSINLSN